MSARDRTPWTWVPSLYFAQGVPYVMVVTVSTVLFQRLGLGNTEIALYSSWLGIPWVIKPFWSPFVELFGTKRRWVLALQGAMGVLLGLVAFALPTPFWLQATLALFFVAAFASATHDIAADGLYMLALPQHSQAAYAGVRSTFYRLAMIAGDGQLVILAGYLERRLGDRHEAWAVTMGVVGGLLVAAFLLHLLVLPAPPSDRPAPRDSGLFRAFFEAFAAFFRKPGILRILAFLLLYRFAEAQLVKLIAPFLLDPRSEGGLGLTPEAVGWAKGTFGVAALMLGGILGGLAISRHGLRAWLWPMVAILHLPDLVFVALATFQPESFALICAAIVVEQFGYGFGFTAYMLYMIHVAEGGHRTAHYAIGTGFMALGVMLPGMWSGWLQEQLGYPLFFGWVMLATIPGFLVAALVQIPPGFGRKET